MKILVIEDDTDTADFILSGLKEQGHTVDVAHEGREGLARATSQPYDVMIVDRMLPGLDGLSIVKTARESKVTAAILVLTTMSGVRDRVEGLDAGADDYLVKPFAFSELNARIFALARRPALTQSQTVFRAADLSMDLIARTVTRGGRDIELQPQEFKLLEYLLRNAGRTVTKTMLLENVWDFHFDPRTNVVETHISRLRSKIDRDFPSQLILTIRGSGYALRG